MMYQVKERTKRELGEDILMILEQQMMVKLKENKEGDEDVINEIDLTTIELNNLGEKTIEEIEKRLEEKLEAIKTGLAARVDTLVEDHVDPEQVDTDIMIEKFYFIQMLQKFGEVILKEVEQKVTEELKEIQDDLSSISHQLVESLFILTEPEREAKLRQFKESILMKVKWEMDYELDYIKNDLPTTISALVNHLTNATRSELEPELQKLGEAILKTIKQGMSDEITNDYDI